MLPDDHPYCVQEWTSDTEDPLPVPAYRLQAAGDLPLRFPGAGTNLALVVAGNGSLGFPKLCFQGLPPRLRVP